MIVGILEKLEQDSTSYSHGLFKRRIQHLICLGMHGPLEIFGATNYKTHT